MCMCAFLCLLVVMIINIAITNNNHDSKSVSGCSQLVMTYHMSNQLAALCLVWLVSWTMLLVDADITNYVFSSGRDNPSTL